MVSASLWVYTPPVENPALGRPIVVVTDGADYAIGRVVIGATNNHYALLWNGHGEIRYDTTERALIAHARQMDQLGYVLSVPPTDVVLTDEEAAEMNGAANLKPLLTDRVTELLEVTV